MILILVLPILIVAVFAIAIVAIYNNLVNLKNSSIAAWHQIDVQLSRRADLVGNLVETVRGYAAHEKTTLENVTNARALMQSAKSVPDSVKAQTELEGALTRLFAVAENYPNLKADSSFLSLQNQLKELEQSLALARENYNELVRRYNTAIESFPANLFAAAFGFSQREYFQTPADKTAPPKVTFS